jgi:hypothetical protein
MMHFLPIDPVIDYGMPREELVTQVVWFCLRGMGLKEEAIRRCYPSQDAAGADGDETCLTSVAVAPYPSD